MSDLHRRAFLQRGLGAAGLIGLTARLGLSAEGDGPDVSAMTEKAVGFLRPRQGADGSWSADRKEPGITALVVTGLLRSGRVTASEPVITKGLAYLEKFIGAKGGLSEAPHSVYATSVALMAYQEANQDGRYTSIIKGSQDYLKGAQIDETEGKSRDDASYGGLGYGGGNSRPDLSNTSFFMEALHDSGLPADDPALQKALIFVSRSQNLKSEFNDQPWAGKVNDGGFVYVPPTRGGPGKGAAKPADAPLRSAAGMTYAGLKSMIYAGLKPDDVRVKAALEYIKKNYTLDENPGQGERGLYYYYQTFAKAFAALGKPTIVDAEGKEHDWRKELVAALAKRQAENGSWANHADSFMEGDANIVTSFALLALASAKSVKG
ncbi:prenyltransferase/squalene oxidase repeat-containing protein [Singulisphaera sp. PoT]|uniref:prenyltransferase/squalene oxidase repeat-containing protein n=1 Tax=Singulisphaera sp. PoT TaxID=3411797 RepID=UPI003BF5B4D8